MSLDANSLVKAVKQAAMEAVEAKKPMTVVWGEVIKVNPLQIKIDDKITLDDNQLILTNHVRDFQVRVRVPGIECNQALENYQKNIHFTYHHEYGHEDKYAEKVFLPEREEDYNKREGLEKQYKTDTDTDIIDIDFQDNISIPLKHNHAVHFKNDIITMRLGLKIGERVILIRCDGGQKYIVLDRFGSDIT